MLLSLDARGTLDHLLVVGHLQTFVGVSGLRDRDEVLRAAEQARGDGDPLGAAGDVVKVGLCDLADLLPPAPYSGLPIAFWISCSFFVFPLVLVRTAGVYRFLRVQPHQFSRAARSTCGGMHAGHSAENCSCEAAHGDGEQGEKRTGGEVAFVDRDPGEAVQLTQDVVLAAAHDSQDGHDDRDKYCPEPDGHALPRSVETGHSPGHVPAAEVGDEQDDQEHQRPQQADGLRVLGDLGSRLIDVCPCRDGNRAPCRSHHGRQQNRSPSGRQPSKERGPDLDPAIPASLGGHDAVAVTLNLTVG